MPRKKGYEIDNVVAKAMYTFWSNGFENSTVRMLEKDMGINQFSIYSSFGNKRDLFLAVLRKYKGHVKTSVLQKLIQSKGDLADIHQFLSEYGHSVCSGKQANGCLMVNTGMEIGQKDKGIARELTLYFEFIKNTFFEVLEKAKTKKQLHAEADSEVLAEYLLGSLQGLTLYAKFRTKREIDSYIDTIMKAIK